MTSRKLLEIEFVDLLLGKLRMAVPDASLHQLPRPLGEFERFFQALVARQAALDLNLDLAIRSWFWVRDEIST